MVQNSWKEFGDLENIDKKCYASGFYDFSLNCYGVECGTSLRFWESKGWLRLIGFNGILDIGKEEEV